MKKRGGNLVWILIILVILIKFAVAPPPTERVVKGTVFKADLTQIYSGIDVLINNTNTSAFVYTKTSGPPGSTGKYSATINASDNDVIYVKAWNNTDWGNSTGLMGNTQANIDIVFTRRSSEPIVVIYFPMNNTQVNSSRRFNVTANITMLGNDATFCNITLTFSNSSPISFLNDAATHNLGSIAYGSSTLTSWNLTTAIDGNTTVMARAKCRSDTVNIQGLDMFTVYNITTRDDSPPNITMISPRNNSRVNNPAIFNYNVTDGSFIMNCTLSINMALVNLTDAPTKGLYLNFSNQLIQKINNWTINCTDSSLARNMASIGLYNLTLNSYPSITSIASDTPVNLIAGSNRTVYCNGTINDGDSFSDALVNASLFFTQIGIDSPLNRSNHYGNSTCSILNGAGSDADFRCTFSLEYFAANGSWTCNATVKDFINSTNSSTFDLAVNPLVAIGVSPSVVNYGTLDVLQISPNDVLMNITNYGNVPLDLNLFAYSTYIDDNISMGCTRGNISFSLEKFSVLPSQSFNIMNPVNNSANPIFIDFNLSRRQGGETIDSKKPVFWKLQIPFGADGTCSGKLLLTAVSG